VGLSADQVIHIIQTYDSCMIKNIKFPSSTLYFAFATTFAQPKHAVRRFLAPRTIHSSNRPPFPRRSISASAASSSFPPPINMTPTSPNEWTLLGTPSTELRLEFTLPTGQSFRWRESSPDSGEFTGVLGRRAMALRQLDGDVAYQVLARTPDASPSEDAAAISDYFNLSINLSELSQKWIAADVHFSRLSTALPGARMMRQDPVECLFSFICSQNNHISRIHGMVNRLCQLYGTPLAVNNTIKQENIATSRNKNDAKNTSSSNNILLYAFPTLEQLKAATEEELRDAGFGYRARYIVAAVEELNSKLEGGAAWLSSLRQVPFDAALESLCTLPGVGPKVAACVALFSLDKHDLVPVDVHVWNLATRRYCPQLKGKTNNPKLHPIVQEAFLKKFGPYAGWAHNTLFIGELGSMKERVAAIKKEAGEEESEGLTMSSSASLSSGSESESDGDEFIISSPVSKKTKIEIKEEDAGPGAAITTPAQLESVRGTKQRKAAIKANKKIKTAATIEVKIE
jgi:N-glycosylase/DNA lyase